MAYINDFSYEAFRIAHHEMDSVQAYKSYIIDKGRVEYEAALISKSINESTSRIVSSVDNAANKISKSVSDAANQISDSIAQAVTAICGKLDNIDEKLVFLNRKMDIVIEQNNMTNMLLANIVELLKIPNSEKERQQEISLGIKFFANASKDPDLFEDSLEHFLKAEEIQRQDYFVLHRIGCIYLFVDKFIDPSKAFDYFSRAAKYAKSESDPNAVRLANILTTQANQGYTSVFSSTDKIRTLAADSYEKAAFSAYILGDLDNAIQNQRLAYKFCSTGENQFLLAKYLAHNGSIDDAVETLEAAIDKVPNLASAIFQERDMVERPELISTVMALNASLSDKLTEMYSRAPSESVKNYIQAALDGSYTAKRIAYKRLAKRM